MHNLVEQKMEVFKKQQKADKRKNSNESHNLPTPEPSKLNKKIKKNHHRKKGNISKDQSTGNNELAMFIQKNPIYFKVPIEKYVSQFKQKKTKNLDIKDILCNKNGLCFNQVKGNFDKQLEVYTQLKKAVQKQTSLDKIGLKSLETNAKFQLRCARQYRQTGQEGGGVTSIKRILKENEYILMKQRLQAIPQLEQVFNFYTSSKGYNQVEIPQQLLQLLVLCKINATHQREVTNILDNLAQKKDPFSSSNIPHLKLQQNFLLNQHMEILNIKNLEKSFAQDPIDFYNYHKAIEYYEDNNYQQTSFDKITSLGNFKKYVQLKKPKTNKSVNYLLRTACTGCLTQYSQMSNPIENCPQCHSRIHRYCQNIQSRCHRCRYGRTSNQQKILTSYCYICNRASEKGLLILTVTNHSPHQFAHVYCLLLHQLWSIENQQLVGKYLKPRLQNHNCIFCQNNQGYFFNSSCCGQLMHGMCAFLNGISFKMIRQDKQYKVKLNCCTNPQLKQRLGHQRKFKINYEKNIFRYEESLYNYIQKRKKKE